MHWMVFVVYVIWLIGATIATAPQKESKAGVVCAVLMLTLLTYTLNPLVKMYYPFLPYDISFLLIVLGFFLVISLIIWKKDTRVSLAFLGIVVAFFCQYLYIEIMTFLFGR